MGCFDWSVDDHHVVFEMVTLRKMFVAHGTGKRPLVGVCSKVADELIVAARAKRAMMASQWQLRGRDIAWGCNREMKCSLNLGPKTS